MDRIDGTEGGTRGVAAWLTAFGVQPTKARVIMKELPPLARLLRSITGLAGFWGAAAVAIFFPVLHLVLVPTLLICGVVAAVLLGRQTERVADVRGLCPRCRTEQEFPSSVRVQSEQIVDCPRCHTNVTLLLGALPATEAAASAMTAMGGVGGTR